MIHGYDDSDKSKVEVLEKSAAATKDDISSFQSQLDGKAVAGHNHDDRYYTETEINTKLNAKQNTINGAASSITSANLTPNRALVSNANGKVAASSAGSGDLANLSGTTGNIQTQLNNKAAANHNHDGRYAGASHNHDDRYYTEGETNNLINGLNIRGKVANGSYEIDSKTSDNVTYRVVFDSDAIYYQKFENGSWVTIKTWT